jgi:DNA-binding transcriptional regulator LsrR (DeoR family)
MKNSNVETLKKRFQLQSLKIVPDPSLAEDSLSIF